LPNAAPERAAFAQLETISEDCLSLNIYTPAASSTARLPVMVWLHGGAWRVGAGSAPGLRGIRLAREGDVVLVTINHRLDVMGFLQIDDGDPRFADAGNTGLLDMIAALRWVRDNIANFGGDENNVTIFGQSGGAAKVATLLAAPAAKGLFHKAIAMSGSGCLRVSGPDEAAMLAHGVAKRLNLSRLSGTALQAMPLSQIVAASAGRHRPVIDSRTLHRHPFDPDAPGTAKHVPLMIGNVVDETRIVIAAASPANFDLSQDDVIARMSRFFQLPHDNTALIYQAYQESYPGDRPGDLMAAITSDYSYVRNTRHMADLQSKQADVFSYMFMRRTPVLGGLLRSPHECDVPFVFGTTRAAVGMVGSAPDIEPLTRIMIRTWSSFARNGNPKNALIPEWRAHEAGDLASMMLDRVSHYGAIPGPMARQTLNMLPPYDYGMPASYTRGS
jgi:para-nitrobenzyl esterase